MFKFPSKPSQKVCRKLEELGFFYNENNFWITVSDLGIAICGYPAPAHNILSARRELLRPFTKKVQVPSSKLSFYRGRKKEYVCFNPTGAFLVALIYENDEGKEFCKKLYPFALDMTALMVFVLSEYQKRIRQMKMDLALIETEYSRFIKQLQQHHESPIGRILRILKLKKAA